MPRSAISQPVITKSDSADAAAGQRAAGRHLPHKYAILATILLATLLTSMSINIYAPALPSIAQYFAVNISYVKLIIPLYLFSYSMGYFCLGMLSDYLSYRKIMMVSMILFIATCLWQGLTTNIVAFMFAHFLQGFTIAAPDVLGKVIISRQYADRQLAKALNYITFTWLTCQMVAPLLGSYIQIEFTWRGIFFILAACGGLVLFFSVKFFPTTQHVLTNWNFTANLAAYKKIISSAVFVKLALCRALYYSIVIVFTSMGAFIVQNGMHKTAIEYGNMLFMLGIGMLCGVCLNRFLLNYLPVLKIILVSAWVTLVFAIIFLVLSWYQQVQYGTMIVLLLPLFIGRAMITSNCTVPIIDAFKQNIGAVNALAGTTLVLMGSLMSAIASLLNSNDTLELASLYLVIIVVALSLVCSFARSVKLSSAG